MNPRETPFTSIPSEEDETIPISSSLLSAFFSCFPASGFSFYDGSGR